ncbi:MAG TPA: YciI family protein [Blastocatellia bacterium]|nr:YciI family protein [Blastocatellia bacterium]
MSKPHFDARGLARSITAAAMLCFTAIIVPARAPRPQSEAPKYEMGTFYLCLLVKGPNFVATPEAQQLQAHLKHVQGLFAGGKAVLFGPFGDDDRIAGVAVLDASSPEEARSLEEQDPFVKSGRFSIEVLKWWAAKNVIKPPPNPLKMTTYYLAFLRHGPKWTGQSTPETQKIQADHMANINAMARTGKLVIAGPFEIGGDYAGLFVFKVKTLDEAKALADSDPAVRAGRLVADVHPWRIAEGSLP